MAIITINLGRIILNENAVGLELSHRIRKLPNLSGLLLLLIGILFLFPLISCTSAKPTDPVAVIKAAYERLNAGDVDGYMVYISDNALIVDDSGRFEGAEAIRADMEASVVPGKHRLELSDLSHKGNVVSYTAKIYEGDPSRLVAYNVPGVAVVKDGLIIFDGDKVYYDLECNKEPSQAFCTGE